MSTYLVHRALQVDQKHDNGRLSSVAYFVIKITLDFWPKKQKTTQLNLGRRVFG